MKNRIFTFSHRKAVPPKRLGPVALILAIIMVLLPVIAPISCGGSTTTPLKIGVLLPLTGPDAMESDKTLDWAALTVNDGGGIGGRPVELVYLDNYNQDIALLAQQFLDDPDINIVIGPQRSADVFLLAPLFIKKHKLLISPYATSAAITRAFGGQEYFYRTVQSDVAQIRCILAELASRQVKRISLLYVDTTYGQTFYQWAGFFATELGMEVVGMVGYDESTDLGSVLDQALEGQPEYIVTVAYGADTITFTQLIESKGASARLFFTDAAETPYVVTSLGEQGLGLELMTPAADPNGGFETAFFDLYGYMPFDFAAAHYDAFILAVCTLARQESLGGFRLFSGKETLADSLEIVTGGSGVKEPWDHLNDAIRLILQHETPDIDGAASSLEFDKQQGVDPTQSFYSLNRVEIRDGVQDFWTIRRFSSDDSQNIGLLQEQSSAVYTYAGKPAPSLSGASAVLDLASRDNLWAVIVCTSSQWLNYRHQADALAMYTLLKKNGLPDDRIIFLSEDDVPWSPQNSSVGNIHYTVNGSNLRKNAVIDYTGSAVNLETLKNVLWGISTPTTPAVLQSDQNSNVLIYIVDHGAPGKIPFVHGAPLQSADLAAIVSGMSDRGMFRQMLIMTEACFGESIGASIDTPGVLYFTGAAKYEASFGATYDGSIKQWLVDDFTQVVLSQLGIQDETIQDLYLNTYSKVIGSHATLVNYQHFGDLSVPVSDFFGP